MADGTIDSLSIEISASSKKAENGIERLADALRDLKYAMKAEGGDTFDKLKKLSDALSSLKDASNIKLSNKLPDQLRNIGRAVSEVSDDTVRKLSEMTAAIDRLRGIDLKGFSSAVKAAKKASGEVTALSVVPKTETGISQFKPVSDKEITDMFDRDFGGGTGKGKSSSGGKNSELLDNMKQIGRELVSSIKPAMKAFGSMLKSAAGYASKIAKSFLSFAGKTIKDIWDKSAFKSLENSLARIKKIISSFERIAFYRAIRSAIKYVTDALKEGTENAYHFAREFGDATTYIADAYDRLSSSNFKMSNQLGAAWATLIATIEPIIIQIINLVTRAADAITQMFALLSGRGTYLKAVDYNKKWAESAGGAAKAAKEWKNQLMGFDEINRLEAPAEPSGGSGSGNPTDYNNMFEETPISKFFEDIKKAFQNGEWANLGKLLGDKVNEIVESVNWKDLGIKFGRGIQGIITTGYNFLKTVDFRNIGTRISEFLNGALENIDFNQLGRLWMRFRTALWDVIYGAVVSLDWALVAEKLSDFVLGALEELSEWLETLEPEKIAKALKDFFGNIKYEEIKEKLIEVLHQVFDLTGEVVYALLPESLGDDVRDGIVNAIKKADFAAIHNVLSYKLDEAVFGKKWADFWWSHGDYAGKEIVLGMINGNNAEASNWSDTMKTNVSDTVDNTFLACRQSVDEYNAGYSQFVGDIGGSNTTLKTDMTGMQNSVTGNFSTLDGSASTTSASVCGSIMAMGASGTGFQNDISGMRDSVVSDFWTLDSNISISSLSISNALERIKNAARAAWEWLSNLGDAGQMQIDAGGGIWNSMNYSGGYNVAYASGGFPEDGLFFANHNELVGGFSNGRTAVANNEMIVDGISRGVYNAVSSAMEQNNRGGSGVTVLNVNGREFMRAVWSDQQAVAREHGVSLIAHGKG